MYTFADFYIETYGVWKPCEQPNRTPDFKSDKTDSKYWDCGDYVVRKSNHWGIVGTCFWKLEGFPRRGVLRLDKHECGMIYYKDFGTSRTLAQEKKIPIRTKFMKRQPDLHHEGPITSEVVSELIQKLKTAYEEVRDFKPEIDNIPHPAEWVYCQANWMESLEYAGLRCNTVLMKITHNKEADADDRKCVDISLCILRDFADAKQQNFVQKF